MKTLEEKKLLVKMMRMFNQPVDLNLIESIEKEERLMEAFFKKKEEPKSTPIPIFKEEPVVLQETVALPPKQTEKPAETGVMPPEEVRVKQVSDYISSISKLPPESPAIGNKELEEVKKTISDLLKKVNTMSWGGGGTGIVRIGQADDFDKSSYNEGYTMQWLGGMFRLAPSTGGGGTGALAPWILKTSNYTAIDGDRIIGDTSAGPITITLPNMPITGEEVTVMDGSDWSINPITIARNGSTIEGISDDMVSNNKGIIIKLVYNGNPGIQTWQVAATLGPRGPAGYGEVQTTLVTSSTYTVNTNDWYIGVNYSGVCNITLPASANTGRIISIKDESGTASTNPINLLGTIDNNSGGFSMQIDNRGVQLIYRNGWRVI